MLARVAFATGRSVFALAEGPQHEWLYEFHLLTEVERLDDFRRRREAIDAAYRIGSAVNDPKLLMRENARLNKDLQQRPWHQRSRALLTEDVMARVNAILAAEGRMAMAPAEPPLPS